MRIQACTLNRNRYIQNCNKMPFEKNNITDSQVNKSSHQYTGIVSADLAYASLFDNEIARDLKIMGLI